MAGNLSPSENHSTDDYGEQNSDNNGFPFSSNLKHTFCHSGSLHDNA